ncbi:MAG: hypothetical protein ACI8P9_001440 [Parasphingorhabdus sp.]|jgi:uncharacterized protein (TIRG00374 family)
MLRISPGFLLKLLITTALLFLVVWKTGLLEAAGRQQFFAVLVNVDTSYLVLSILAGAALNLISSWKWWWLLRKRGVEQAFWRLVGLYYVGRFYNMFLPTSVGGDVVRVYGLGRFTGKHMEAAASVIVDRLSGFLMLLAMACGVLMLGLSKIDSQLVYVGIFSSLAGGLIIWWVLVSQIAHDLLQRLFGRLKLVSKLLTQLGELRTTLAGYNTRSILLIAMGLSLLFYLVAILNVYVTARAFSEELLIEDIATSVPIIMVIMNLPISIGGIGLMESAYTFVFEMLGIGLTIGLSTAILMRIKTIIDALIGGGLHFLLKL